MYVMPPYKQWKIDSPISADVTARGLNLPTHSSLTEEDIEYIEQSIKSIIAVAK
jgi:dTDP-4-amino-4,6-dideoxygalactose transaminase